MCVGIIRKSHLNIDVVLQLVSNKVKTVLGLVSNVIVIFFLVTVMRYSISFIQSNADQTTPYILFPMSYMYAIFPITIVVMVIALLLDTWRLAFSLAGKARGGAV
jgi:TRAP-type C4-dicarboxylate transport system permease small subunit